MTTKTTTQFVNDSAPDVDAQYLNIQRLEMLNLLGIDGTATDATGNVNDQQAFAVKNYVAQAGILCTDTGSANAYIVNASSPYTNPVLKVGSRIRFKTNNANTGASTIAAYGNPAAPAKKEDGSSALTANDIQTGIYNEFVWDGTNWVKVQVITKATSTAQGIVALPVNKIIPLSNNATDATNDIDVGAGWFNFDDGTGQAYYAGGTGQLDVLFSAGGNGMLDTGTIANTTYHLFLIYNPTTLVSKILASASLASPTLPSGYTKKARVGSIIRASGAILPFEQFDKKFILGGAKIVDRASSAPPTTASNQTITAPLGINTLAISLIELEPVSATGYTYLIIEPTTHTSTTPTSTNHTFSAIHQSGSPNSLSTLAETKTNTSAQILINANINTSHTLRIIARGWIDYQLNY